MKSRLPLTLMWFLLFSQVVYSADATISVDVSKPGIQISPTLWGLFFEEINFAGDGGIYAELVRQRDFEGKLPLESWSLEPQRAEASMELDPQQTLNDVRRQSLRIEAQSVDDDGEVHLVNSGFWGVPVRSGERYQFSLFLKGGEGLAGKPLVVSLRDASLKKVYAQTEVGKIGAEWQKLSCTLVPNATDFKGRLALSLANEGTLWVDMVSLFPPTYKHQPNGLRPDLVKLLADLKPSFFRFPGGCYAEGLTLADTFLFKETLGPIEGRKGRNGFWNYNSTDGLGYYEYLRLSEDLGADPIYCINPGGNSGVTEVIPLEELGPWLETAVDAIEFAIGPPDSEYGAKRAAMGHPEPFNFKTFYLQVGNETEFGRAAYVPRFEKYRDFVKTAYPGENVQIIADSWGMGYQQSVDTYAIDFHQYMSWGRAIADRDMYDDAPRGEPFIFKGEYATRSGSGILQALSEAVHMMGLEENSDEVVLAAYAPLFGNVNECQWNPNLIYYDNHRSMGTISYYVQKMYSEHRGSQVLPVSVEQEPIDAAEQEEQLAGSVGLATWNTKSEYDDLRVVVDGETVYENSFDAPESVANWKKNNNGQWQVVDGRLRQISGDQDCRFWLPATADNKWSKYEIHCRARKLDGGEGFMVMFHTEDNDNYCWANLGGWGNSQHGIERAEQGSKLHAPNVGGNIETDRWYDLVVQVDNLLVKVLVDGKEVLDVDLSDLNEIPKYEVFASAVTDDESGDVVVRLVNIAESVKNVTIDLDGASLTSRGQAITLAAENRDASQNLDAPEKYVPKTTQLSNVTSSLQYELPACSFTILRLHQR